MSRAVCNPEVSQIRSYDILPGVAQDDSRWITPFSIRCTEMLGEVLAPLAVSRSVRRTPTACNARAWASGLWPSLGTRGYRYFAGVNLRWILARRERLYFSGPDQEVDLDFRAVPGFDSNVCFPQVVPNDPFGWTIRSGGLAATGETAAMAQSSDHSFAIATIPSHWL